MSPRDLQACEMFQPAEKACWEILLREYPDFRDVSQAALDSAMDQTLQQLWAVLAVRSVEEWLQSQHYQPPLSTQGDCALNLLLPYFNTGKRALELVVRELSEHCSEIPPADRARMAMDLSAGFELLVHWQLQGACTRCGQAPLCRFGDRAFLHGAAVGRFEPLHVHGPALPSGIAAPAATRNARTAKRSAATAAVTNHPRSAVAKTAQAKPAKKVAPHRTTKTAVRVRE